MATRTHGHGTKLSYDTDGVDPYTDLAEIVSVECPDVERGDSPNTDLDTANRTKSYQGSALLEPGILTFVAYMTKTQFATLLGFLNSGTTYYWRVAFPLIDAEANKSRIDFQGYVKGCKMPTQVDVNTEDLLQVEFRVKATTRPAFTAGT